MVISVFVFVTGSAFLVAACFFLRKHSTAAISRVCITEAAYDNPTYKVSGASKLNYSYAKMIVRFIS